MARRRIISDVLDYIDAHIGDKLTLQTLSDISGYSVVQITRLFESMQVSRQCGM